MGQSLSCGHPSIEPDFFAAVQFGELKLVESILRIDPGIIHKTTSYGRLSSLHIAAANGHEEMLAMLLERWNQPDVLNRHKQTPLMMAAMRGKIACVEKLIQAGANILMFDSVNGRSCHHYAAYYGHSDCLESILQAAHSNPISQSWGFTRFVNVKDGKGATPLHLAAKQGRPSCVKMLLDKGALVCASTGEYGSPGSTPLHLAARRGCIDSVRELLAFGADRLQMDSSGRIPYAIALKRNHMCSALLNPSSAEPLVWPSPLKFISELNPEVKLLLETALIEANKKREDKILKGLVYSFPSPEHSVIDDDESEGSGVDLCSICFEQVCTIEVQNCGHQMCAQCTLSLCCHTKPNPTTLSPPAPPLCPFCRSNIARLAAAAAKPGINEDVEKDISPNLRRSRFMSLSEGSGSFKGISSAMGSFGKIGSRGSGRRILDSSDMIDKS